MAAPPSPEEEPDEREEDRIEVGFGEASGSVDWDMSQLADRISSVQDSMTLERRLESLEQAWVLVFDADTDDEAVYSMEMSEENGAHVVLAFECATEARKYADTLRDEPYDSDASVQALDVAALVVTSREADFRVGVVFKGDFEATEDTSSPFITTMARPDPERMSLSITIVPDHIFEGRTASEFLDPAEDPVWVLVHDEGTGDAQYFSMTLNGTSTVVCFKDIEAAERCSEALQSKGTATATARSLMLEDLLDTISEGEMEVCLVDEVVETLLDENDSGCSVPGAGIVAADCDDEILGTFPADGQKAAQETSAVPMDVRAMLDKIFVADAADDVDAGDDAADADSSQ